VQIIQTDRDVMKVPTESTKIAAFGVTAEEGTYDTDLPVFGEVSITIYKFTKNILVSEELLADNQVNMEAWMSRRVGDAWGLTESKYAAVGTGSSQPEGVFEGGTTNALTFDTSGNITPDEIPELMYKLAAGYAMMGPVWLMDPQTEGYLRKLRDTSSWAFPTEPFYGHAEVGGRFVRMLEGYPVYNDDNIDTISTGKCVIMYGVPWYYCLVERQGLSLLRDPYTAKSSGQVNFWWNARFGGAVLQAGAWQGGIMA
jgi:HK97 family phage major capsid protein